MGTTVGPVALSLPENWVTALPPSETYPIDATMPTERRENKTVTIGDLYQAYVEWSENTGERAMTKNLLTMKLKERGFARRQSGRRVFWLGLRLRLPGEPETNPDTSVTEEEVDLRVC